MLPTICGNEQLSVLQKLVSSLGGIDGEVWECGVYKGGSACLLLNEIKDSRIIRLFDTFGTGIPTVCAEDTTNIQLGQFAINLEEKKEILNYFAPYPNVHIHQGFIPDTFQGLEHSKIALAHIDVDVFETYNACLDFIFPRMPSGGFIVCDDYAPGFLPGATKAIDDFTQKYGLTITKTLGWGCWFQK